MYQLSQANQFGQVCCICYLCGMSVFDVRSRRLPIVLLLCGLGAASVYQILFGTIPLAFSLAGAAVGVGFLAVSKVTGEAIGYGDSFLILELGIYLGFWNLLYLLMISFTVAAVFAMAVLVIRHFKRKTVFPFVPFLLTGYVAVLLSGGLL